MIEALRKIWFYFKIVFGFIAKIVKYAFLFALLLIISVLVMFVAFPICLVLQCVEPLIVLCFWAISGNNYYEDHDPIILRFFGLINWMTLDEFL